jgi:hypothetical protein
VTNPTDLFGEAHDGLTRKQILHELIQIRRRVERLIGQMAGDPEHRDYVAQIMAGNPTSARSSRYDGPEPVEIVMQRFGVDHDDDGEVPDWFMERFGKHLD